MYRISCPWCGERDQWEFKAAGEGHIHRPVDPSALSDGEWADYVFMRRNPKGVHFERWVHAHGCRRWFHTARNTVTDEILAVYSATAVPPALSGLAPATPCGESHGSGNIAVDPGGDKADRVPMPGAPLPDVQMPSVPVPETGDRQVAQASGSADRFVAQAAMTGEKGAQS